jgi:polysaccharide deacetylase 2 family uncharacterized protein YibQ
MSFLKRFKRFPFLAILIAVSLTVTAAVIFLDRDKRLTDRTAVPDGREVKAREKASIRETPARSLPRAERRGRQIAILIDDIGFDLRLVEELARIRAPIAFAVLPQTPHAAEAARLLHGAGKEILLHLPMEPRSYPAENPGAGALFTSMDAGEIRSQIEANLTAVPYASGVNNHMGSLFMENEAGLSVVMEELAKRGLFFVDSRTTPNSLGRQAAAMAGVRFTERAVFIDHHRGYTAALTNLTQPHRSDWEKGKPLLLIGHPHDETIRALREAQSHWREEEVQVIPVSAFISMPGGEEKKNALVKYR